MNAFQQFETYLQGSAHKLPMFDNFSLPILLQGALLCLVLVLIPAAWTFLSVSLYRRTRSRRIRTLLAVAILPGLVGTVLGANYWLASRPGQKGLLCAGYSPTGREYCVVQSFKCWLEPYQVSFYIRDPGGLWHWNYLEHEDTGWRTADVEFHQDRAVISRNGKPFRTVELAQDAMQPEQIPADMKHHFCAKHFHVHDVLAIHNHYNKSPHYP